MRVLLIAPNWIGDAVMAQPLLALLARRWPSATFDAVAAPHIAPVIQAMPEIHSVLTLPLVRGTLQLRSRWQLAATLRERRYDRCYVLPNSFKTAITPWLARIPIRIGHRGEARYGLLNRRLDAGSSKARLMVEHYAMLAQEPGQPLPNRLPDPVLRPDPAISEQVRRTHLAQVGSHYLVLCPGAEYGPAKRWPTRHFAALVRLASRHWPDTTVVCLGAGKDRGLATEIRTLSAQPVLNLAGDTQLDEAIAIIAMARGVVSNDSGLMHVAAALGRPLVAVFGSSDPRHTPPLSPNAKVQWLHLSCSPCFARTCPMGHTNCLNQIEPAHVMSALEQSMREKAADSQVLR